MNSSSDRIKSMKAELRSVKLAELHQDLNVGIEQLDMTTQFDSTFNPLNISFSDRLSPHRLS